MRSNVVSVAAALLLTSLLQVVIFPVAGPLPVWRSALSWFALVPLLWLLLRGAEPIRLRSAAMLGYASGVLWYLGTCYWIYSTMHLYGGLNPAMSAIVVVLFSLYLGLYHLLFAVLLALVRRMGIAAALIASPFLWVAVELARARITSFPWNLLGYAQIDNAWLTALAPVTGVYGISFVLMAVNAAIAGVLLLPRQRRPAAVAMAAAVLATGVQNFGTWFRPAVHTGSQKAILLQPNLAVGVGEQGSVSMMAASSARLTIRAAQLDDTPTAIALWPESPSPFQTNLAEFTDIATSLTRAMHAPLIAGAAGVVPDPSMRRGARVYNSAALFTPEQGLAGRYDKIHLVPFGEYVPYANLFSFASGLTEAVGSSDRGDHRVPLTADGHKYGVFLCYESIFGDEVRQLARQGAEVLTNLSDDGWYGDTSAPFQHLNMARMRAIENHRWLLRDTNTGVTAAIDPNGRVVETMTRHQRGAAAMHFDYLTGTTFYTDHGDVFAYACTLLAMVAVGLGVMRKPQSQ